MQPQEYKERRYFCIQKNDYRKNCLYAVFRCEGFILKKEKDIFGRPLFILVNIKLILYEHLMRNISLE